MSSIGLKAGGAEEKGEEGLDLRRVPLRALNMSTRLLLSQYLNPEQVLMNTKGLARDYRGLAEIMGFSYFEVRNFQRTPDPTRALLEAFEVTFNVQHDKGEASKGEMRGKSLQDLVEMLETIERLDVVDDVLPSLTSDGKNFLQKRLTFETKQAPGVSPMSAPTSACSRIGLNPENGQQLTVDDAMNGNDMTFYDAYVCYSDQDYPFVMSLVTYLESPQIGLKLFVRERDLLVGTMEYDAFTQLMQTRCPRMLIILSPDFLTSPDCEYQTRFATGLAIEQRSRKLIPIVYKSCDLPPIVKFISKIDLTKANQIPVWTWRKLVVSIKGNVDAKFVPPPLALPSPSIDGYLVEVPHTPEATSLMSLEASSIQTSPSAPSLPSLASTALQITETSIDPFSPRRREESNPSSSMSSNSAKSTKTSKRNWIKSIKEKITGSSSSSSGSTSFSPIPCPGYQPLNG